MFEIQFKDNSQASIEITDKLYTIGCDPENSIVVTGSGIAAKHAKIIWHEGRLFLQDFKDSPGSWVNDKRTKYRELLAGDEIRLGTHIELVVASKITEQMAAVADPATSVTISNEEPIDNFWQLIGHTSWLAGQEYVIKTSRAVLGRAKDADIMIPGTHLSRHHAEIIIDKDGMLLRDLDSANGTFLNDIRVTEARVNPGDIIRLDVYSFRVVGPQGLVQEKTTSGPKPITFNAEDTLQRIRQLKEDASKEKEKNWVLPPTSVGNREHVVPKRKDDHRGMIIFIAGIAVMIISILVYLVISD